MSGGRVRTGRSGRTPDLSTVPVGGGDPIAAILGTPLYFSTALFVPIADALAAAGVGLGAMLALTIPGSDASVPEFLLLTKLAGSKILAVFVAHVRVGAIVGAIVGRVFTEMVAV